jgi:hypothetical protein
VTISIRRFGMAAAIAVAVAGTALVDVDPAEAASNTPNACRRVMSIVLTIDRQVQVQNKRLCWDPDVEKNFPITLEKQPAAGGPWQVVATGAGFASYRCQGTATSNFRVNSGALFATYACD